MLSRAVLFASLALIASCLLLSAECNEDSPPVPVFADNYKIEGLLTLPYADLNEPFTVYYDKKAGKSRSDFYGDLYQVYQFSPDKSSNETRFGALYKFAWVPASFNPHNVADNDSNNNENVDKDQSKTKTRRACFKVSGSDLSSIDAQGVLPNLADFFFESYSPCPSTNVHHLHSKCELWKKTTSFNEKANTYKFWVKRDPKTKAAIPVQYYMQGYDTLLGSHYDRYDFKYFSYEVNGANDKDFRFATHIQCESMPGPGDDQDSSTGASRANMIVENPLTEFINEPHRYDHVDHSLTELEKQHGNKYDSKHARRTAWRNLLHNTRLINNHNRRVGHYKLRVNRFAVKEVKELSYLRGRYHSKVSNNGGLPYKRTKAYTTNARSLNRLSNFARALNDEPIVETSYPESWDWRIHGAVTPVKDQAVCGSCWSFGTSGTIEGAFFVKTGKLVRLSQQQMVDCSWAFGNNGCDGGEDFRAYKYLMQSGGLSTEDNYGHYKGVDAKCHDNDVRKTVKLTGFYNVTKNNIDDMKDALLNYGPVTVGIDASRPTFTFYSHGVYYDDGCKNGDGDLDHQVLVVGYGKLDGHDYWLVKNSWSTLWGNDGYVLMSMKNNNCGVLTAPTVPIVERAD